jgi:hypothetical protein
MQQQQQMQEQQIQSQQEIEKMKIDSTMTESKKKIDKEIFLLLKLEQLDMVLKVDVDKNQILIIKMQ